MRQVERCLRTRDAVLAEHVLVTWPDFSVRWLGTHEVEQNEASAPKVALPRVQFSNADLL